MKQKLSLFIVFILTLMYNRSVARDFPPFNDSSIYFSSQLSPSQIYFIPARHSFSKQPHRSFDFGITGNEYCYVILKIQSERVDSSYVLSIDNTSLDTVLIYRLSEEGQLNLIYSGGNLIPYISNRQYVWHIVPLHVSPAPGFYLIALKALSKNVNVSYQINRQDDLQRRYSLFDRVIYFYTGIISLIIFACLLGFLMFKNKGLIIYSLYVLSLSAWIWSHYGYLYPAFYPYHPLINEVIKPVASLMAAICLMLLIRALFQIEIRKIIFHKMLTVLILIDLTYIGTALFYLVHPFPSSGYTFFNIGWNIALLISGCGIIVSLVRLLQTNKTAKIFFIAISAMVAMVILQILSNSDLIHSRFLNDHGILLASLLEILILTFGIFYNVWEDKKLKEVQISLLETERREALQMLIRVQDNERKRIAEDLHDSIGPMLAAIKINFLRLVKLKSNNTLSEELADKTENIIEDSISEIRNISHQLMPKGLSSKGLISLLADYFQNLQVIYDTSIQFSHEISISLCDELQLNIYRIMSELALNAARHSGSKNIEVSLKASFMEVEIKVLDHGKGFNAAEKNKPSLGLKNVESRVTYLKGKINASSIIGEGTMILISIPVQGL